METKNAVVRFYCVKSSNPIYFFGARIIFSAQVRRRIGVFGAGSAYTAQVRRMRHKYGTTFGAFGAIPRIQRKRQKVGPNRQTLNESAEEIDIFECVTDVLLCWINSILS